MREEASTAYEVKNPENTARIWCWNVNGIRATMKNDNMFERFLERARPDILCLNETKIDE